MAASYPDALKTFLTLEDGVDTVFAKHPNDRGLEIVAIETELGLLPKGPDSDVVTRLERGPVIKQTNKSGASRSAGDMVIQDTATDNGYTTTTTQGDTKQIFVVRETTADNAEGHVQESGRIQVQAAAAVTRGNFMRSSTTAGKAEDAGAAIVDGAFARALETIGSAGLVWVQLIGTTLPAIDPTLREDNLVENGSFEEATGGVPDKWTQQGGGVFQTGALVEATDAPFGNSHVRHIVNPGFTADHSQSLYTLSAAINNYWRGKIFSAWALVKLVSTEGEVFARIGLSDGSETMGTEITISNSVWTVVTVTKTFSGTATALKTILRMRNEKVGTATIWWDGACTVMGPASVRFLAHPIDVGPYA